jgi:hypothetical protein
VTWLLSLHWIPAFSVFHWPTLPLDKKLDQSCHDLPRNAKYNSVAAYRSWITWLDSMAPCISVFAIHSNAWNCREVESSSAFPDRGHSNRRYCSMGSKLGQMQCSGMAAMACSQNGPAAQDWQSDYNPNMICQSDQLHQDSNYKSILFHFGPVMGELSSVELGSCKTSKPELVPCYIVYRLHPTRLGCLKSPCTFVFL